MAQQVTNSGTANYNIPAEYGGGVLVPGASIIVLDSLINANNLFGAANPGQSTDPLTQAYIPDSTPGAISPGQIDPLLAKTSGNWAGAAPTNAADAINRMAAAVFALRGNVPIP